MNGFTQQQMERIRSLVEADLDDKIKQAERIKKDAQKLVYFRGLIRAALEDAGHHAIARHIETSFEYYDV